MLPYISRSPKSEQSAWLEVLSAAMPEEQIVPFSQLTQAQKQACDLAIVANPDPKELQQLTNLKWVHSTWAGVERMLLELDEPRFEIVRLVDPQLAETMSEAVLAWTLYLHREMPSYAQQQAVGIWQPRSFVRAQDRTVGILGLGALGTASAERLKANNFNVMGWSRQAKEIAGVISFTGEEGLAQVLKHSDILVCLLPLTHETKGLLGANNLAQLPEHASLINFARGPIVDDQALLAALESGAMSHAVLDVFNQEPLPKTNAYWQNPRVTVLPHISAQTYPISASKIVADNVRRYRLSGEIPNAVNVRIGY